MALVEARRWLRAVVFPLLLFGPRLGVADTAKRGLDQDEATLGRAVETLPDADERRPFYRAIGDRPLFAQPTGLTSMGEAFLRGLDGLERSRFAQTPLDPQRLRALVTSAPWTQVELAFAQCFLALEATADGVLNPASQGWPLRAEQHHGRPARPDPAGLAVDCARDGPWEVLSERLAPKHAEEKALREALASYRALERAGGWPILPDGPGLKLGSRGPRVKVLRQRLAVTGELSQRAGARPEFDPEVREAVQRFQRRHGLDETGEVDPNTLAALRIPVHSRVVQLELNLERWRWTPQELGERYVMVNLAASQLTMVRGGRPEETMKVVVGRPDKPTPRLVDHISGVGTNPEWSVPPELVDDEIVPLLESADRASLDSFGISAISSTGKVIPLREVPLSEANTFKYVQAPGSENAMGRLKFQLNNPQHTLLHDTHEGAGTLFDFGFRAYSNGCVRVEDPEAIASFVLGDAVAWRTSMNSGQTRFFPVSPPVPVYFLYFTAFVDDQGSVHFARDTYGLDRALAAALQLLGPAA